MIVVDSNVIAYCFISTPKFTDAARALLAFDPSWNAPLLWRSEFRTILLKYVQANLLNLSDATQLQLEAEDLMKSNEFNVDSEQVLELAQQSGCTAYDCEFIAVAKTLGAKIVTADKQVLKAFAGVAIPLI
jgi:predicted nucleic acid-binding protein